MNDTTYVSKSKVWRAGVNTTHSNPVSTAIRLTVSETLDIHFLTNAGGEHSSAFKISISPEDSAAILEGLAAVLRNEREIANILQSSAT